MTTQDQKIIEFLKRYLEGDSSYWELHSFWNEEYIEKDEQSNFEEMFSNLNELIYMGQDIEPTKKEKGYGLIGPKELKTKIKSLINKELNIK